MSTIQNTPKIPLPKGWKWHVWPAVLRVTPLAQYAVVFTRSGKEDATATILAVDKAQFKADGKGNETNNVLQGLALGEIYSQKPRAGATAPEGSSIAFRYYAGIIVPNVQGTNRETAEANLTGRAGARSFSATWRGGSGSSCKAWEHSEVSRE